MSSLSEMVNLTGSRVYGSKFWNSAEGNLKQYRAVSTGKLRNEKYELDRVVKLETYYFDDAAHEAMTILSAMDDIDARYFSAGGLTNLLVGSSFE